MITRLLAVSSATLALAALTALPVSAASLTSNTDAVVDTSVGVSGSSTASMGSTTVDAQAGMINSTTTTTTTTVGTPGISVILNNTDAAVTDFSDSTTVAPSDPSMVATNDDLNAYAASTLHSDPNILNVSLSDTAVAMSYKVPGRFLGFIPVTVKATATVNQDGTVTVSHPWYDFLTATSDSTVGASVGMQAQMMASQNSSTSATFSAQMQAQLMADLQTAFMTSAK